SVVVDVGVMHNGAAIQLIGDPFDDLQYAENSYSLYADIHFVIVVYLHYFNNFYERSQFAGLPVNDAANTKRFYIAETFLYQLLITGLKNMAVHFFPREHYDA